MSSTTFYLFAVAYYLFAAIVIIVVLNLMTRHSKKKYNKEITELERDKNLIISASILSELNKVEALLNNENMKDRYREWQKKFKEIRDKEVPKITDQLIEIEDLYNKKQFKKIDKMIAEVELEIFYVKAKANFLLDEIKEITLSESRNRETITKLKTVYREILTKYHNSREDFSLIGGPLELQFENVDKLFSAFELAMDNNQYEEVGKIVKGIDDMVGNLSIVTEEAPSIIMMGKSIIPTKIKDIKTIEKRMTKEGYNLEFLNIEYNTNESEKKIQDIFARLNVLNVEDSIFELKTMLDYFDSIYNDFDKEKISRKLYDEYQRAIIVKALKLEKISNDLIKKLADFRFSYDLNEDDVKSIENIRNDIKLIKEDYEKIINLQRSKTLSFSKLAKEMELLNVRLVKVEDALDIALRTLGSLKEDELRAREQLDEIKELLKQTRNKIGSFKLPIVPKKYYIELSEATQAIREINRELDKKPISIKILNTRVDTARDLTLKLYATTNETIKTAWMAEMAIVYGNRYRPVNKELDLNLVKAENAFYKGNYKNSLENAINAINAVEPGIHKRLIDAYQK